MPLKFTDRLKNLIQLTTNERIGKENGLTLQYSSLSLAELKYIYSYELTVIYDMNEL